MHIMFEFTILWAFIKKTVFFAYFYTYWGKIWILNKFSKFKTEFLEYWRNSSQSKYIS
jgi:hypothetical protein